MAATTPKTKRSPSVLVTDARDSTVQKQSRPSILQNRSTRLISVDNVLQYASDIPSGQRRGPAPTRQQSSHLRTLSGRQQPVDTRAIGRTMQHRPSRSSKVSEKLVLLPETEGLEEVDTEEAIDDDEGPPRDEELQGRRRPSLKEKTYAERLPKSSRTEKIIARCTAYCTAQGYKMKTTAEFVRNKHGARTKLYDDCLYTVYHLPLLPGTEGFRIRSSPVLKSPGGKAVLDEEIERYERHEYRPGFFGEEQYHVKENTNEQPLESTDEGSRGNEEPRSRSGHHDHPQDSPHSNGSRRSSDPPSTHIDHSTSTFGEMFIYSYGVVVFWNFTERQEKDILADFIFSSPSRTIAPPPNSDTPFPPTQLPGSPGLAIRPQLEEDFETEEFHFEYNPDVPRPRIYNDMITLRTGDHMIKLTMSHSIAQSTKLSFFEDCMSKTMNEAQYVPRKLALTGELGMKREEVTRILGKLFVSRVDVNLSSNMLDTPNFFWDSEPTLHPLYTAVREYLEIGPRIKVLNERCRVFLDLAEILSDSIADRKMSRITWIIIVLIAISILVTCSEVFLRFGIVSMNKGKHGHTATGSLVHANSTIWNGRSGIGGLIQGYSPRNAEL